MKYFFLLLLFFPLLSYAQSEPITLPKGSPPPEARAFEGDVTKPKSLEDEKKRQPNVEIWLPPEFRSSEQKWPLLVFSHGFGGCAKQSLFLMKYLADHGYIVIAPDHTDANCRNGFDGGLRGARSADKDWPERPFKNPETWNDQTESDRRDDVLFAVSSMLDDRQYMKYIDTAKMGLIGHSLGGYTVLGIAGAWPSWKDKRFKAVLALSSYVSPYMVGHTLKRIDIPVMYQGGTRDIPMTPTLKRKGGAYDQSRAVKYFIELNGANHFSWTESDPDYQDIIKESALAFFDTYVKGTPKAILPVTGGNKQIKTFWKDEGIK